MAFVSVDTFKNKQPSTRQQKKSMRSALCKMAVHLSARKGNPNNIRHSLSITISEDVMKKSRMIIGDRVEVMFDDADQTLVLVRRVQHGGYAISNGTKPAKQNAGECMRGNIKFSLPEKLPFSHGDVFAEKDLQITPEGIVIQFEKIASSDLFA